MLYIVIFSRGIPKIALTIYGNFSSLGI